MNIGNFLEKTFEQNRFLFKDAALGATGAVLSGCFLKRWITVLSPINGAIYMLAQTVTAHVLNRMTGGERDLKESDELRWILSHVCGFVVAIRVITPNVANWTFASSTVISLLIENFLKKIRTK